MASRIKNMTEGKPVFLIITFALPLMVGNVFQQLYTVVDTMVVGKALGVGALAALGAADWLNWMMLGTIQGLTQGFGILMAQEFGAGRPERLRKVVGNATILSVLGALLLLAAGQLIARPVLVLLQTPEEIIGNALLYLRIMFLGVPIVMAYNFLASILRSLGDGKTPLHAMIVAALTNIVLDLVFVLVFHWGIAGAAVATLIGQFVSVLFCLWHIRQYHYRMVVGMPSEIAFDAAIRRQCLFFQLLVVDKLSLVDEQPREGERVGRSRAVLRYENGNRAIVESYYMLVIGRLRYRFGKRFGRLYADYVMHPLFVSPTFPRGEQSRNGIGQSVLESRYYNPSCAARHPLHVPQHERAGNGVRLSSAPSGDYDGGMRPYQLCEPLRTVKVNRLPYRCFRRSHCRTIHLPPNQLPRNRCPRCRLSLSCISQSFHRYAPEGAVSA